ncbi:hypothetical protein FE810_11280 [Thalassotalea litorea]|uniref:DUF2846 domain-containing protein n=1 Tax=Thalassotalea litorea TaxID=2020715 RepID=A0A5R9IGJ8_9GAMM|nr:hypothetical protein [Thalassotalea litorea]TLU64660.1 hypothetical protein FE810_11280 [Thalassotalea litorea]
MRISLPILLLFLLQSCAHNGGWTQFEKLDLASGQAGVYIFYGCETPETKHFSGPAFWIDGEKRGYLPYDTYYSILLEPGIHEIQISGQFPAEPSNYPKLVIAKKLLPNIDYYFEFSSEYMTYALSQHMLEEIDPKEASALIQNCKRAKKSYFSSDDAV